MFFNKKVVSLYKQKNFFMKKLLVFLSVISLFSCSTPNPDEFLPPSNELLRTTSIGNQVWSTKNLDVVRYNNGDPIPYVSDPTVWKNLKTGAWCYYDNDSTTLETQGRMYNFYAVTDSRGIAPSGFKVPNKNDWQILSDYLGGDTLAGSKLKSDSMKFNITYTGCRGEEGAFCFDGSFQGFWTSDSSWGCYCGVSDWYGVIRKINTNDNIIRKLNIKMFYGYSVRCLKN